jgi:hypothetical protein
LNIPYPTVSVSSVVRRHISGNHMYLVGGVLHSGHHGFYFVLSFTLQVIAEEIKMI